MSTTPPVVQPYEVLMIGLRDLDWQSVVEAVDEASHLVTFKPGYHTGMDIAVACVVINCGWSVDYPSRSVIEEGAYSAIDTSH